MTDGSSFKTKVKPQRTQRSQRGGEKSIDSFSQEIAFSVFSVNSVVKNEVV